MVAVWCCSHVHGETGLYCCTRGDRSETVQDRSASMNLPIVMRNPQYHSMLRGEAVGFPVFGARRPKQLSPAGALAGFIPLKTAKEHLVA